MASNNEIIYTQFVLCRWVAPRRQGDSAGKIERSGTKREGQSIVCGGGFVDCPHWLSLARSASRIRQMVLRLHALLALVAKGRVGTRVQGALRRSRFRICDDRRNDMPGPPTQGRRKRGTQNQAIGRSRGGLTTKIAHSSTPWEISSPSSWFPASVTTSNLVDKLIVHSHSRARMVR